jgi:hypothetical protein
MGERKKRKGEGQTARETNMGERKGGEKKGKGKGRQRGKDDGSK